MFYSHEILTSRQYGVATVWLVATLGSKSTLKKVTRKAILDVDVPKACQTIQDPSAPMALRLQGNLLYGVSRVYSHQCSYVLADTQSFREKMKGVMVIVREMEVDPDTAKARPDQLDLPDDPAFFPDFDMNLDLSMFDISGSVSGYLNSLTPPSILSSRSSVAREPIQEPVLVFPSADTPLGGDFGGFGFGGDISSALKPASLTNRVFVLEDTGMIEDPGFEYDFDAEGNLVERPTVGATERVAPLPTAPVSKLGSEPVIGATVDLEHEASLLGAQADYDLAFDNAPPFVFTDNDDVPIAEAPPFSPPGRISAPPVEQAPHSSTVRTEEEVSSSVEAPQRKSRAPKALQPDHRQELANADLALWNNNYLMNMAEATKVKQQHKSAPLAKKNAAFWVLGQGIAGVGISPGDDRVPNPLEMFAGQTLLAALTGREESPAGTKRTRSVSDGLSREVRARRMRARGEEEQQLGRADAGRNDAESFLLGDDEGMTLPGEDMDIEIGRHAPESLRGDHSSQMPWNVSGSRHGSARQFGSGLATGISSSAGGRGAGIEFGPPSALMGRWGSRLTSASPLLGRGVTVPRYSSLELPEEPRLATDEASHGIFDDSRLHLGDDPLFTEDAEFQLYGPPAAAETQTAAQRPWVAAALDTEAHNFLAFLTAEMVAKVVAAEQGGEQLDDRRSVETVTFEGLLPPDQYSKIVAAQGLLHVLSLATKGWVEVRQEEAFDTIEIGIVATEEDGDGGQDVED